MWRSCLHKLRDIFLQVFLSFCKPPGPPNQSTLGRLQYFVPGSFPNRFQTFKGTHPCRPSTKPCILFLWISWGCTASRNFSPCKESYFDRCSLYVDIIFPWWNFVISHHYIYSKNPYNSGFVKMLTRRCLCYIQIALIDNGFNNTWIEGL